MNEFATWDTLTTFGSLTTIVFLVTEFLKDLPPFKSMPTKYFSFFIAIVLIILSNLQAGSFNGMDITLYVLSAMFCSLAANGISDFNFY